MSVAEPVSKPLASRPTAGEILAALYQRWGSAMVVVGIIAAWQLATMALHVPIYILPQPSDLIGGLPKNGRVLFNGWATTLLEAAAGFVIGNVFSVAVAFLVTWSPTARAGIMPVALAVKSVPIVAITPLITLAVGLGHSTVVTIAAIVCFFPTLVNVSRGLRAAPSGTVEVLYLLNANPRQYFWKLRLPYALPFLFTALRITVPAAIGGTMLAEYVASNSGLGYMIQDGYGRFQFVLVWQIVVLATITTLSAYLAVAWCEARALANRR